MKRILLGMFAVAAVSFSSFTLTTAAAQSDQQPSREERMQHWAADHQVMMDAKLGGMKEALKPTANQYPLWEAFESAVRNADKTRMDDMREMMKNRESISPVERLDAMAGHMARRASELKSIAEAAKPFYASLDDTQKRNFAMLGGEMLMPEPRGPEWDYRGGAAGFSWEPYGWSSMMR
jgi:hypothetical protein